MAEPTYLDGQPPLDGQDAAEPPSDDAAIEPVTWDALWGWLVDVWGRLGQVTSHPQVQLGLMVAILLLGAGLRFTGIAWDENQHLHPDERFLTMVENGLRWPKSFKEYLDSSKNPLNPYNSGPVTYVYGLFPVVMAKFLGQITGKTGYDGVYLVGRVMNGGLDLVCVLLVFLMGKRLYDARIGLVGALMLALSVFNIQNAHFFTVDLTTTFFVTLAMYFVIRVAQGEGWGSVAMLAVAFGLAVSAKISVLSFPLVIGLAYILRILGRWQRGKIPPPDAMLDVRRRLGRLRLSLQVTSEPSCKPPATWERLLPQALAAIGSLIFVLALAFMVFRLAQPHAFTGPGLFDLKLVPKWREDMEWIARQVAGDQDYPPSHQWTSRALVFYMLKNMVLWGFGLPLGITVWAAWFLMAYEMYRRHTWAHLLPWVWMTFTFFYQSVQLAKYMRYLLPIYPTMTLMAGYGLVWLWDKGKEMRRERPDRAWARWLRPVSAALVLGVVLGTAFWAFAFTSIYTRPVTRIAASRWIYENIPRGSTISFEEWDDPVPLNVDGRIGGAEYKFVKMALYWEDIPEKREQLYSWLEQTEYIALTSNRLYGSIPRLYMRYPMTTRYYEALFSGELGYEPLITFTSRPKLFGIEIMDDNAEESFTVYDHPKVIIFKKRPDFSLAKVHELFDGYDLERIVRLWPRQVSRAPNSLMLYEDEWQAQREGGTWSRIFDRNSVSNKLPTLFWLLALYIVGWCAFPLGFVALRRLRDRGYILSKTLGLLLMAYLSWLPPSLKLLPYTRGTIVGALLLLALGGLFVAWHQRQPLHDYVRARWRLLIANELLFLVFFALFWLIRRGNPDLWHPVMGGEKPMDMAYLNAIIKSTYFPPYDPWFAGGYINYYYFGWVVVATMIKLTGIVPWVAYNLAIPTFFAAVAMGACSIVYNLIPQGEDEDGWFPRAFGYGVVGACLVAVVGNLGEVQLLFNGLKELGQGVSLRSTIPGLKPLVQAVVGLWQLLVKGRSLPFRPEWWYWNASRVMHHGEINEFPFFTFLYADLHAHLTAMPFALLALALASSLVVRPIAALARLAREAQDPPVRAPEALVEPREADVFPEDGVSGIGPEAGMERAELVGRAVWWERLLTAWRRLDWAWWLRLTLLALTLGELYCNNSWDFPTYLGVTLVALAIGVYGDERRIDQEAITKAVLRAAYVLVLSLLFYRPYHARFGLAYSSVELWKGERTSLGPYLIIHATPLFILTSYLIAQAIAPGMRNGIARALRLFWRGGERYGRALALYDSLVRCQTLGYELGWIGIIVAAALFVVLLLSKAWILALALPILILAVAMTLYSRATPEKRLQTFLIAAGLALTLAVEYIVIKGDIGRMNTVFKFYLQVWIMWGIVAAVALEYLVRAQRTWRSSLARPWRTVLTLLLVGVSLYPLFATYGKVRDRWDRKLDAGLDGMAYMSVARYHDNNRELVLEHDRQAITWMQDHIVGSPVIAEANTPLYRWGSRVSIYTGLPSIVGWDWHQKQQRASVSSLVVDWRLEDLRELFNTQDTARATELLKRYHVGYIYVGELERAYYDPLGLLKFEQMVGTTLDVAYHRPPVTIYRVRGSGAKEIASQSAARPEKGGILSWLAQHWLPATVHAEGPEKERAPLAGQDAEARAPTLARRQAPREPLMLGVPVDQLPVLRDRGWNRWASASAAGATLGWWLVLQVIGLLAWPLVARACASLADRGYGLAKGIGLLLVSYLVWVGASLRLVANSPPIVWGAVLLVGGSSFFCCAPGEEGRHGSPRARLGG